MQAIMKEQITVFSSIMSGFEHDPQTLATVQKISLVYYKPSIYKHINIYQ